MRDVMSGNLNIKDLRRLSWVLRWPASIILFSLLFHYTDGPPHKWAIAGLAISISFCSYLISFCSYLQGRADEEIKWKKDSGQKKASRAPVGEADEL